MLGWLEVRVPRAAVELVSHRLWERGAVAIEERDDEDDRVDAGGVLLVAGFATSDDLLAAAAFLPGSVVIEDDGAWRDVWKRYARPYNVGNGLTVVPAWCAPPDMAPDLPVVTIDPGASFGLDHATTKLCLEALVRRVTTGMTVLDVGCGSGILAIGSVALGASRVVAVDVDQAARRDAEANVARNDVAEHIAVAATPLERVQGSFDLVVANLGGTQIVVDLAAALIERVAIGGLLVLSGMLTAHVEPARAALTHLELLDELVADGWSCLVSRC